MNEHETSLIRQLYDIAVSKKHIDKQHNWSKGSITYFEELKKEIDEVGEELETERFNYLEDELGDVLWDYLNLLINLESEGKINFSRVFERSVRKFGERIEGLKEPGGNSDPGGSSWKKVKALQKKRLAEEWERVKLQT
ncbi:MAG: hypothetical protein JXR86_04955 [Spirochaetales bacterium]|nr:hypothetical protein [Spirochaetales bacterium]